MAYEPSPQLYRRHLATCKHKAKGNRYNSCQCPVWVYVGRAEGKQVRFSLKTCNWTTAMENLHALFNATDPAADPPAVKLSDAVALYIDDCNARGLAAATVRDYSDLLALLCANQPAAPITAVTPQVLTRFRASRGVAASTSRKELMCLRAFFHWAIRQKMLTDNPASAIRPPLTDTLPKLPFTQAETAKLIEACDRFSNLPAHRDRARALVLTLLFTGLRIGDVAFLRRDQVDWRERRIILRTAKTGAPVSVKVPPDVISALDKLQAIKGHLFWRGGHGHSPQSAARQTLHRLGALAGVANVHPHRFRDTFACRMLEFGHDMRTVQHLLGHSSMRTTERHYAPFVASHQRLLDDATASLDFLRPTVSVIPIPLLKDGSGDA